MATKKLEPAQWGQYFDEFAKSLPDLRVAVSVMAGDLGVQPETEGASLIGVTYDPHDNALEIIMPNATHQIANPKEIYVQEEEGRLQAFEVIAEDGTKQLVEVWTAD